MRWHSPAPTVSEMPRRTVRAESALQGSGVEKWGCCRREGAGHRGNILRLSRLDFEEIGHQRQGEQVTQLFAGLAQHHPLAPVAACR